MCCSRECVSLCGGLLVHAGLRFGGKLSREGGRGAGGRCCCGCMCCRWRCDACASASPPAPRPAPHAARPTHPFVLDLPFGCAVVLWARCAYLLSGGSGGEGRGSPALALSLRSLLVQFLPPHTPPAPALHPFRRSMVCCMVGMWLYGACGLAICRGGVLSRLLSAMRAVE